MLNIVSKIQNTFSQKSESKPGVTFSFIKDRQSILKALSKSQESGKLIGVYCRELGEGMFLTGVDSIEQEGTVKVIIFETYDLCGKILNRTRVSLDEIKMVCPFDAEYVNPLIGKIENKRTAPVLVH